MYADVIFIQDSDGFSEFEHYLDESEYCALLHLMQWYYEIGEVRPDYPTCMGYGDVTHESDGFIMIYNRAYGVCGLWAKV